MKKRLYLILHDIRSAYNVGAIFRTADGAGVKKIFLTGYTPLPATKGKTFLTRAEKMLAKTALGAEQSIVWEHFERLEDLIAKLKSQRCQLLALEKTSEAVNIKKFEAKFPAALLLGNEVEGVASSSLAECDNVLSIEMRGMKESLNVSVAAGIAMYELLY
jgi:tRNA G18 (ribose-2'-O)-methylase SpoU